MLIYSLELSNLNKTSSSNIISIIINDPKSPKLYKMKTYLVNKLSLLVLTLTRKPLTKLDNGAKMEQKLSEK